MARPNNAGATNVSLYVMDDDERAKDGAPQKDLRNEREQVRHGRRAGATNVSRYVTDDEPAQRT